MDRRDADDDCVQDETTDWTLREERAETTDFASTDFKSSSMPRYSLIIFLFAHTFQPLGLLAAPAVPSPPPWRPR